jgi:hypothetical protein
MFDCSDPLLVLETPTYHPVLNHHTGYIFRYFEYSAREYRELFFEDAITAQVFANKLKALLVMDPNCQPARVSALTYVLANHDDDSRYMDDTETPEVDVVEPAEPPFLRAPWVEETV